LTIEQQTRTLRLNSELPEGRRSERKNLTASAISEGNVFQDFLH
jgi:hypothetical protein